MQGAFSIFLMGLGIYVLAMVGAGWLVSVSLVGCRISQANIFLQVRNCIAQDRCPNGHDKLHVLAERASWFIMGGKKPDWRVLPGYFAENCIYNLWYFKVLLLPVWGLSTLLYLKVF